jgi:hypothetical protein
MLNAAPAEMAVTPLRPLTGTGTLLPSVVPLPSCPEPSAPHAITAPLPSSARL